MFAISPLTPDDPRVPALAELAREIWIDHYVPIVGRAQIDYMLARFQSTAAIRDQIREGMTYLVARDPPVAYAAYRPEDDGLFLSKIYVRKDHRGKGLARALLERMTAREGEQPVRLTVNRHNTDSIAAYRAMGFAVLGTKVQEIGGGYVMDDLVMRRELPKGD